MEYQPLAMGLMQHYGRSLLRAIQNDAMIPFDLLVREAVQNSLDAAEEGVEAVTVDMAIRTHASRSIGELLTGTGIGVLLEDRFPSGGRLLEVRDRGTAGLNGPLTINEVQAGIKRGNLMKLVYEVGQTHDRADAGGSWGLGKTVHYRMGVGLVFFYSRTRTGPGSWGERLAACLVEDQTSPHRLLEDNPTGIAWWGALPQADGGPVTDPEEISRILGALGADRFREDETGTSVIIPFLREDLVPAEVEVDIETGEQLEIRPWWHRTYSDYLRVALQRWFCVRLNNPAFATGPQLKASVDGCLIKPTDMLPIFGKMQVLYNRIMNGESEPNLDQGCFEISLNTTFLPGTGTLAGRLGTLLLTAGDLQVGDELSPFTHLYGKNEFTEPPFRPVVAFLRRPGMIVRWEARGDSEGWAGGFKGDQDGRFLFALFVPESGKFLRPELCSKLDLPERSTLEAYLRSCEMADHSQWNDRANFTMISRIRKHSGRKIKEAWKGTPPADPLLSLRAARNLADRLLPPGLGLDGRHGPAPVVNNGSHAGSGGGKGGGSSKSRTKGSALQFETNILEFLAKGIRITWNLAWGNDAGGREVRLLLDSENGPITHAEWTEATGFHGFPFCLSEFTISGGGEDFQVEAPDHGSYVRILPREGTKPVGRELVGELLIVHDWDRWGDLQPVLGLLPIHSLAGGES